MKIICKKCGTEFDSKCCPECGTPREEYRDENVMNNDSRRQDNKSNIVNARADSLKRNNAVSIKKTMLEVVRWGLIVFLAIMLLGALFVKAWIPVFLVILSILALSPLNKYIPYKIPKYLYGIVALISFFLAIIFYPSQDTGSTEGATSVTKNQVDNSAQETPTIDRKTQKKITKIEKYIADGKYDKAFKILEQLNVEGGERARLYGLYYSATGNYQEAERILFDYCSNFEPLSEVEEDPCYDQLFGLYDNVPDKQEELNLLKHFVYVSKVGPELGHDWIEADCVTAKKCKTCGEKSGEPMGHEWIDATCTVPRTCNRCGENEGVPLGHEVKEWKITQRPTCSEEGVETGICLRCGEEVEQSIAKIEHIPGEWEITKETTSASVDGEKSLLCKECGAVIEKKPYTITEEEELEIFKDSFESVSYEELSRYPDSYKDKRIKVKVNIVDELEEGLLTYVPYKAKMGGKDIALSDGRETKEPKLLKGDTVTVYGVGDGTETVKTKRQGIIFDKTIDKTEIPMVKILYCEIH